MQLSEWSPFTRHDMFMVGMNLINLSCDQFSHFSFSGLHDKLQSFYAGSEFGPDYEVVML